MRPHKFAPGRTVKSIAELDRKILSRSWLYLCGIPKHPSIFDNMSLRILRIFIRSGSIRIAKENPHAK